MYCFTTSISHGVEKISPGCGVRASLMLFCVLPYISFILVIRALEYIKRYWETYVKSLYSRSDLPPDPPYGSNWGHKIADFIVLQ